MNELEHGVTEQKRVLAIVEAPSHFVEVRGEMLRAHTMPRSHDAALQERESGFDGVGMNVPINVVTAAMLNRLVLALGNSRTLHGERVRDKLIRHNHVNVIAHVLFDVPRQCASLRILRVEEAQIAVA